MADDHLYRIDLLLLKNGNKPRTWLARHAGIPEGTMAGWWSKKRMPNADQMVKVARVLGTTVEFLITGDSPPEGKFVDPRVEDLCDKAKLLDPSRIEDLIKMADVWAAEKQQRERLA